MLSKTKVLKSVKEMPEQFSVNDLIDKIILIQKMEEGNAQSVAGKVVSTVQAKKRLSKWLK